MSTYVHTEEAQRESLSKSAKVISAVWEGEKPGIEGKHIYLKLEPHPFKVKDYITYDLRNGVALVLDEVRGDLVIGRVLTTDIKSSWCPSYKLQEGVEWYYSGKFIGEGYGRS